MNDNTIDNLDLHFEVLQLLHEKSDTQSNILHRSMLVQDGAHLETILASLLASKRVIFKHDIYEITSKGIQTIKPTVEQNFPTYQPIETFEVKEKIADQRSLIFESTADTVTLQNNSGKILLNNDEAEQLYAMLRQVFQN